MCLNKIMYIKVFTSVLDSTQKKSKHGFNISKILLFDPAGFVTPLLVFFSK